MTEDTQQQLISKLRQTTELLDAMAMELRFRGCDDQHKLIREAQALNQWLRQVSNCSGESESFHRGTRPDAAEADSDPNR